MECRECAEHCGEHEAEHCAEHEPVTLKAKVLRVCCCHLLVCDLCTHQEIHVHTPKAGCFRVGDHVCIEYSGAMTMSIPPQITADRISCLHD